jgi:acyl-CoA thioester hydrolase
MSAVVKTRLSETKTVRMDWDYRIQSLDGDELYVTGKVTLVGIDRDKGKIVRQLPDTLQDALVKLAR